MFDTVIQGIFSSTADITLGGFLIGVGSALVLGIAMAFMYMYKNKYTKELCYHSCHTSCDSQHSDYDGERFDRRRRCGSGNLFLL